MNYVLSNFSSLAAEATNIRMPAQKNRYTVPAGKFEVDQDLSIEDCASREALEEAGVECKIVLDIGWFSSRSKHDEPIQTRYFLGQCKRMLDHWQEDGSRERRWFSFADALKEVGYKDDLYAVINQGFHTLVDSTERCSDLIENRLKDGYPQQPMRSPKFAPKKEDECLSCDGEDASLVDERYISYPHQVGGHFRMVKPAPGTRLEVELPNLTCNRLGLVRGDRVILKPCGDGNEDKFYYELPRSVSSCLLPFTPVFYGLKKLNWDQLEKVASESNNTFRNASRTTSDCDTPRKHTMHNLRRYLVLEDLGGGCSKPCFLDLKVGCRQRAARHNKKKRDHMAAKAAKTTSAALGFRICGMQCYNAEEDTLQRYDKYWGQQVTVESMCKTLSMFFTSRPGDHQQSLKNGVLRDLVELLIEKVEALETALRRLNGMRFWGSSLLVLFDGALAEESTKQKFLRSVRLKIIDFANFESVSSELPDTEFLCGISNIRTCLQAILEECSFDVWSSRLMQPPSPEVQDAEQEQARKTLEANLFPATLGKPTGDPDIRRSHANLKDSAATVSGATGKTLMKELAAHLTVPAADCGLSAR